MRPSAKRWRSTTEPGDGDFPLEILYAVYTGTNVGASMTSEGRVEVGFDADGRTAPGPAGVSGEPSGVVNRTALRCENRVVRTPVDEAAWFFKSRFRQVRCRVETLRLSVARAGLR